MGDILKFKNQTADEADIDRELVDTDIITDRFTRPAELPTFEELREEAKQKFREDPELRAKLSSRVSRAVGDAANDFAKDLRVNPIILGGVFLEVITHRELDLKTRTVMERALREEGVIK